MTHPDPAASWRQPLLECFTSESATLSRLTVVNDPDQLFAEPVLRSLLAERGYELLAYDDPVAFRYLFEHRCRPRWEAGEPLHVVVVNAGEAAARTVLPYDLLSEARATQREFSFSLPSLLPSLDPNVLSELEPSQFDALNKALQDLTPGQLGANATQDFLLNHLYEVVPGQIRQPADLLRLLLRRHLRQQQLPALLAQRLLEQLCLQKQWREWPLERLLTNRAAFFSFLQERWPLFLQSKGYPLVPGRELPAPQLPGPELLPFDHDDIRIFIDNLFAEGLLEPTTAIAPDAVPKGWMRLGVVGKQAENAALRLERLVPRLEKELPAAAASRVAAGDSLEEVRAGMWDYLEGKVSGDKFNSDRGKTMTVLTRIWAKVPPAVDPLKTRAVAAFQSSKVRDHLALHWAMAIASYPVFSDVAATAGRLLSLQNTFSLAQLTKRMVAQWSERPVLVKSTQRIIRSLVDWGALVDTETKGVYGRAPKTLPVSREIALLLCEALLLDNEHHSLPANQLLDHPEDRGS